MLGHDLRDYVLLGYGGAGTDAPLGYAADDAVEGRRDRALCGGLLAWGCACMDYAHRRHSSVSADVRRRG